MESSHPHRSSTLQGYVAVSYTHLDVYKRQDGTALDASEGTAPCAGRGVGDRRVEAVVRLSLASFAGCTSLLGKVRKLLWEWLQPRGLYRLRPSGLKPLPQEHENLCRWRLEEQVVTLHP